ncbi:hypothetical protein ILFOPFJJ_01076 [Ensifer psoraleae]|uniref:hypothetical protein n=1 Tax=Sinorhizobium psoraleae TaxID=520838 RepID=UPI0015689585|nr:hypothetical protein [Sinorhizobium psoraleae]NRP70198.1 hypothetical protein [Sinorhizobium psoraleae]
MEKDELVRLRAAVAKLVVENPIYAPIFERLEIEIASLEASDPIARARAIVAGQKAIA